VTAGYFPPSGTDAAMMVFGVVSIAAALRVVTSRQLVHAVLWLVVALGAVAGCFVLLAADVVAWIQILVYVGAVVVLLLFGLMLTRTPMGSSAELTSGHGPRWIAAITALATAVTVGGTLHAGFADSVVAEVPVGRGNGASVGGALFRSWVLPFELLSVLLLAALVGALVLSHSSAVEQAGGGETDK
jgi:NADH-quinone oxidoreductase subunit J